MESAQAPEFHNPNNLHQETVEVASRYTQLDELGTWQMGTCPLPGCEEDDETFFVFPDGGWGCDACRYLLEEAFSEGRIAPVCTPRASAR